MRKPDILDAFRGSGLCEYCGILCVVREAAHVFAKGMGGTKRLNVRENLVSLGSAFECGCHYKSHYCGKPSRKDLLDIVAKREGTTADALEEFLWAVRRLDKSATQADVQKLRAEIFRRSA